VLALGFFLTVAITAMDPAGITRYVPEPSQIESVYVSPYASDYYLDNKALVLRDAQEVQEILDIHSEIVTKRGDQDYSNLCLRLRYNLRSGVTVNRKYYIDANSELGKVLAEYFSDFRYVTGFGSVDTLMEKVEFMEFYTHSEYQLGMTFDWQDDLADSNIIAEKYGDREDWIYFSSKDSKNYARGLLEAIYKDCQAGNMSQNWEFHSGESEGSLTICLYIDRYTQEYLDITIYSDCKNAIAYLRSIPTE
jgi:hypothetical protein